MAEFSPSAIPLWGMMPLRKVGATVGGGVLAEGGCVTVVYVGGRVGDKVGRALASIGVVLVKSMEGIK